MSKLLYWWQNSSKTETSFFFFFVCLLYSSLFSDWSYKHTELKKNIYSIANLIKVFINKICITSQQTRKIKTNYEQVYWLLDRFCFFVLISLLQPIPILIGAEESSLIHNLSPWSMFCSVNAFNSSKSVIIMMLITCRYAISAVYVGLRNLVATHRGAKVR